MPAPFHLKLTGDFFDAAGRGQYADIGLSVLDAAPHVAVGRFAEHRPEIGPDQLAGANGVIVLTPKVTARSVAQAADLLGSAVLAWATMRWTWPPAPRRMSPSSSRPEPWTGPWPKPRSAG